MSTLKVDAIRHNSATSDAITMASDGTCTAKLTSIGGVQLSNRNKVHNGDMRISQRYGTNAHTPSNTSRNYVIDRWAYWSNQTSKASVQQVTDAPAGFYNSAKCTSLSAHTADAGHWFGYLTTIEAQDMYDLAQGTANAKNITLSFYVKSSITGTWAAAIRTKPGSPSRSYPFNYTINSANTWERKTITIPGSTDGTWLTGNSEGMTIWFDLGTGSGFHATANQWFSGNATGPSASPFIAVNGATWLVTGVQLESGDIATSFEHRSFGDELSRCQRYFYKVTGDSGERVGIGGCCVNSTEFRMNVTFPVTMRIVPTIGGTGTAQMDAADDSADFNCSIVTIESAPSAPISSLGLQAVTSGMTGGQGGNLRFRSDGSSLTFDAEF